MRAVARNDEDRHGRVELRAGQGGAGGIEFRFRRFSKLLNDNGLAHNHRWIRSL